MVDRLLTEQVKATALGMGMDLVGFAPVERWKNAPYLLSPPAILPEAKTVVVAAIHITDTWTEMGGEPEPQDESPGGWQDQNSLLDRVAYAVARQLHATGCKAIPVASSNIWRYRQHEGIPSLFAPDLSHIHAATAAGLAEIGWSGLAITPEFGSRCRFISIVTSAELVPTPMYDGPKLCDMCMECVKHCPSAALRKELQKPHEVVIGGKTFKYANKNIWRCAWAEHFSLNLKSPNLEKWEHIGEKEILTELESNGIRGHERGVCQKVCVPPHLRTREGSFGRTRLIAQNRINKRYPENMPTLRKMRDDLCAAAIRMGVDAVSVGPLKEGTEASTVANCQAPGMRSVLAVAMRIPTEVVERERFGEGTWGPMAGTCHTLMHHILLKLARMVEDCGYHAASYTGSCPPYPLKRTAHFISDRDGIIQELAEQAGLGTRDADGFLNTPEFGRNVILGAVVTDALPDPTPAGKGTPVAPARPAPLASAALRTRLERLAEAAGVSIFGVAPAARIQALVPQLKANVDEAELGESVRDLTSPSMHGAYVPEIVKQPVTLRGPEEFLPGAKSVIVLGMHFPAEIIANAGLPKSQQVGTYAFWQYQTNNELQFAAISLIRELSRRGFKAALSNNLLQLGSTVDSPRGLLPDARSNALEAVAAGLGTIGRSGALLTAEHGPHQRRIVIVTDAELPADAVRLPAADPCAGCSVCEETCPMQALERQSFEVKCDGVTVRVPKFGRHRCDWSKKYSLCADEGPGLIGNDTQVTPPQGRITIADIAEGCAHKDPVMKTRTCVLETCLRQCPAGAARAQVG
ncbi:MAG: hypothetical protein WC789_07845 [Lentisphaeria bacterium]|jgi:epoxyqueuosine reductase QueG